MIAVVKSAGATVANRALQLVVQSPSGFLVDVFSAAYQILDTSNATREVTPLQVVPATPGERQAVDTVAHRIGRGRYAAVWAPAGDANLGRYVVRWFYRLISGGTEFSFDQEVEVVSRPYQGPHYATLYDLSAAGMVAAGTDDGVAQRLIVECSRYVEHYTGRQFAPFYKSITVSGRRGRALQLNEPVVAIEGLNISHYGDFVVGGEREASSYRVFNRHLTQNLFDPDDRQNPRLEFLSGWDGGVHDLPYYDQFARGVRNVQVNGIFGYTEPDGSHVGATPELIRLATKLLCFKQQAPPGSQRRRDQFRNERLKSEYTRDQGYIMADPSDARGAPYITHTLDPEIDSILNGFRRGPRFGAV